MSKTTGKKNSSAKNDANASTETAGAAGTGTATMEQTNPTNQTVQTPANPPTPMPQGMAPMAAPMGAALPVSIVNGRIVLPDMLPDEAAEFERRRQENEKFAAAIKARKEQQMAALNGIFANAPALISQAAKAAGIDLTLDHETFASMYAEHRAGTLGMEKPANGSMVKTGHRVPQEIQDAVERDLRKGDANVLVADRYKVSLPWVSGFKKAKGLTTPRKRK